MTGPVGHQDRPRSGPPGRYWLLLRHYALGLDQATSRRAGGDCSGGLLFNRQQHERGLQVENQCAQDEALQAYLDYLSERNLRKTCAARKRELGYVD